MDNIFMSNIIFNARVGNVGLGVDGHHGGDNGN